MNKLKLSPPNIVILAAGVVMFIASFLAFHKLSSSSVLIGGVRLSGGSVSFSAWSRGSFLIATLPALLGVVMAAQVAVVGFAPAVHLPERILGLTWNQVHLVLAFQATIMMLAFVLEDTTPVDKGLGMFVMLIAAIALLVGAIMRMQDSPRPRAV